LRAIEEMLFERGIVASYESVRRWCDKFGTGFVHRVKAARRKPGSTWHLDELFVMLRGDRMRQIARSGKMRRACARAVTEVRIMN
jgi:transposase-like protein